MNKRRRFKAKGRRRFELQLRRAGLTRAMYRAITHPLPRGFFAGLFNPPAPPPLYFHPDAFSLVWPVPQRLPVEVRYGVSRRVGRWLHPCGCDAAGPITGSRCGTCGAEIHGLVTTT